MPQSTHSTTPHLHMRSLLFLAGLVLALVAQAQPTSTKTYTVNERNQLTAIHDTAHPESDTTLTYDENGNRLTKTQGAVEETLRLGRSQPADRFLAQ